MLDIRLKEYAQSGIYPFHMPGHKRQLDCRFDPYEIDITEIEGFDNLHHAAGILKYEQERAAKLYDSKKAYYLVNGSTCGLLAAICAATNKGDKVLVARNCHKAVYHALFLNELSPVYLYPEITSHGIQGQIRKEEIQKALEENTDIRAVILTSPTYDGVVSDIKAIAELVHEYQIPLIVDEAHGAHFGFSLDLPENATRQGADAVIVSVHKTLPAFTQTALLHICSDRIDTGRVEKYLGIFETSSPSYILMAGISRCVRMLEEEKEQLFSEYRKRLEAFYQEVQGLEVLKILRKNDFTKEEAFDFDETKILILTDKAEMSGNEFSKRLLYEYDIQLEMAAGNYALALSSLMDTEEGFQKLAAALKRIDWMVARKKEFFGNQIKSNKLDASIYRQQERVFEIHQAETLPSQAAELDQATGKVSANYLYLYPPGIPFLVPGERITEQVINDIRIMLDLKMEIEGLTEDHRINIVNPQGMDYTYE